MRPNFGNFRRMQGIVAKSSAIENRKTRKRDKRKWGRGDLLPSQVKEGKQNLLQSLDFHKLSQEQKVIARKAANGKEVSRDIKSVNPAAQPIKAARLLASRQAANFSTSQIVNLVIQLPANRQKRALFSMPGHGAVEKEKIWQEVQSTRSEIHAQGVRQAIRQILQRNIPLQNKVNGLANQLMTVSPIKAKELLSEIPKSLAVRVRKKIVERQKSARAFNFKKRGSVDGLGVGAIPEALRPIYRKLASAKRAEFKKLSKREQEESWEPELNVTEFFEILEKEAERRGIEFDAFKKMLSSDGKL